MEESELRALRTNHCLIVDSLDLKNTTVLDHLVEEGIISSDEQEAIFSRGTSRDQNAHLLYIVKRKKSVPSPFTSLMTALLKEYSFLVNAIIASNASQCQPGLQIKKEECEHCPVVKKFNSKLMPHRLFCQDTAAKECLDEINKNIVPRRTRAHTQKLMKLFKTNGTVDEIDNDFSWTLEQNYRLFHCKEKNRHKIELQTRSACDEQSQFGSHEEEREKDKFYVKADKNRRDSEKQISTKVINPELQNLCQLCPNVPKSSPNDKRLMRLCSKGYHTLFLLRESGDWAKYDVAIGSALKSFRNNPDLQMIILRTEMTTNILYMANKGKAKEMFDKAMVLLPSTSMPNWHIVSFLAQKIDLCIRSKKLEEGRFVLELAHQTASTLAPGIGTAAVYLFEALYLAEILRCTKSGTKSESIKDRVKMCFLTASKHYKEETLFDMQFFANQVYLYLALFALGVDFRNAKYIAIQNVHIRDAEVALAEHYLNLFENECWETSTNWSRMLFFIGRAEQHKVRSNLARCLDYLKAAKECNCIGKFQYYIDCNLEYVQGRHEQNIRVQEEKLKTEEEEFLQYLDDSEFHNLSTSYETN